MKSIILLVFFFSCTPEQKISKVEGNDTAMGKFRQIDDQLNSFAKKLNAKIENQVGNYYINGLPIMPNVIEERRIIWIEGLIGKSIIIAPFFETGGVDSTKWNFYLLAWLEHDSSGSQEKPIWQHYILKKVEFGIIEKDIYRLLNISLETLQKIKREDLR